MLSTASCMIQANGLNVQVWLAKHEDDGSLVKTPDGKEGLVGINCLTKIQVAFCPRMPARAIRVPEQRSPDRCCCR